MMIINVRNFETEKQRTETIKITTNKLPNCCSCVSSCPCNDSEVSQKVPKNNLWPSKDEPDRESGFARKMNTSRGSTTTTTTTTCTATK